MPPNAQQPEVVSLGCRMNAQESVQIRANKAAEGLVDAVVVNTCAVTGEAVRQARQVIRRARRERPTARILVTGCAAQIDPAQFAAMPEVDHVFGNAEKLKRETYTRIARPGAAPRVDVSDILRPAAATRLVPLAFPARARTFLPIQNGCDHRCTFCVIPYGRGPSRSVPADDVIAAVRHLVAEGVQEIVLTGVDITSWGGDLGNRDQRLGDLVRTILGDVPELPRLRLSSLDQAEADERLIEAFGEQPRLMPHVHLSMQHGNDLILKRMKRRHSRNATIALCSRLRRQRPDIAIGADLIAGFPTETEAHFRDTLSLIEECGIEMVHSFPYSARAGTPAARMPQIPASAIKERASRLAATGKASLSAWFDKQVGTEIKANLEGSGPIDGRARTPHFATVKLSAIPAGLAPGDTVPARVRSHDGLRLMAEALT